MSLCPLLLTSAVDKAQQHWKKLWECQESNPGYWEWSKNPTSVLCTPPINLFSFHSNLKVWFFALGFFYARTFSASTFAAAVVLTSLLTELFSQDKHEAKEIHHLRINSFFFDTKKCVWRDWSLTTSSTGAYVHNGTASFFAKSQSLEPYIATITV